MIQDEIENLDSEIGENLSCPINFSINEHLSDSSEYSSGHIPVNDFNILSKYDEVESLNSDTLGLRTSN